MKIQRLAVAFIGMALLIAVGVVRQRPAVAQTDSAVLRAQAIELVDSRGRVRAQLNVEDNGEVLFRLRDANGTIRLKLGASEAGSGLVMMNERTEPAVHVLAKRSGTSLSLQRGEKRHVLTP
ncbi:MAG TPA: hypothetical protein VMO26_13420 [Vicinamibacterales bacterium]|nr:hypothetical protein [Vicinamibacterales bacterium]